MTKLLKIGEQWLNPNHIKSAELIDAAEFGIRLFMNDVPEDGAWNRTELASSFYGNDAVTLVRWLDANSDRNDMVAVDADELRDLRDTAASYPELNDAFEAVEAECKKLRAKLDDYELIAADTDKTFDRLVAEHDALRADRDKWQASANNAADHYGKVLAERDALRADRDRLESRLDTSVSHRMRLAEELDAARKRIAELEPPFKPGDVVHLNSLARFRDATVVSTSTTHYVRVAYSYGDGDDLSYTYPASDLLLVSRADESEATDGR